MSDLISTLNIFYKPNLSKEEIEYERISSTLPYNASQNMLEALDNYLIRGYAPGRFLESVLTNDLISAVNTADYENKKYLVDLVLFIQHNITHAAYGDKATYNAWRTNENNIRVAYIESFTKRALWENLTQ